MPYRADIDGLRAVAVLGVVAFHFGIGSLVGGGYVGVDLFFVISGYLITARLFSEMQEGRHDIATFYERRIRRIFPALVVVLSATLVIACWMRPLVDLVQTGEGVAAAALSFSNISFYRTSGYFDEKVAGNPALHTWSLAVEEQFYLLLPMFMHALRRLSRKQLMAAIAGLSIISLLASEAMLDRDRDAAFYLMPFRAWELLLGSLLALARPASRRGPGMELLALAGLASIVFAIVDYDSRTRFPGFSALLPCLGGLALIHAGSGSGTLVSRLLSCAPLRFIGLISYSLYLVHWPLMILAGSLTRVGAGTPGMKAALMTVAILLATLSWYFVERPFRRKTGSTDKHKNSILMAGGASMLALAAAGSLLPPVLQAALPLSPATGQTLAYLADSPERFMHGPCFLTPESVGAAAFDFASCLSISPGQKNVLILGDSHAAHLRPGLSAEFPHIHFLQATAVGCKPLVSSQGAARCTTLRDQVIDQWLPLHRVDTIVVSARWSRSDIAAFAATAGRLKEYADRVVMLGPTPEYDRPLASLLAWEQQQGLHEGSFARGFLRPGPAPLDATLAALALPAGVSYVSSYQAFCQPECRVRTVAGAPMQFDYGHLTREGSAVLAQALAGHLAGLRSSLR